MRVTIINQFYVPDLSPTAHLSRSLAEHLAARGHEVTVVTSWGGYVPASQDERRDEREGNPSVYRVWTPRLGKATVIKRCIDYGTFYLGALWRMLALPHQDVIISLTTPPYIAWTGVAHKWLRGRARLVPLEHGLLSRTRRERSDKLREHGLAAGMMRAMNRALFRNLDHLIGLDTAMIELLMSQYAPPDRDLPATIIPNWEQASFFPRDAKHEPWAKAGELGLDGRFVVLYLGNMGYGHRFETVIDAAEHLRDEPVTFLFIGGGSRFEMIEREKNTRHLDNIILHDYVPKEVTPSVMASADCALITLRDRILGVMSPSKLHSNLAMGLPVIYVGPAKSNVDDAIRRFECGVSLRHGQADELVAFIRELMRDRAKLDDLSERARHAFDQAYNDSATLPQFDAVIDGLTLETQRTQKENRKSRHSSAASAPLR